MKFDERKFKQELAEKIINAEISDVTVGYFTRLHASNGTDFFHFDIGNAQLNFQTEKIKIDTAKAETKTCLTRLINKKIDAFDIDSKGNLSILIDKTIKIFTPSSDVFEAWEIRDNKELHVVCRPGGELAIWLKNS